METSRGPGSSGRPGDDAWLDLEEKEGEECATSSFVDEQGAYADSSFARVRARADKGDVAAQFELCMRYHFGRGGVEQNDETSYFWCRKAADQGHAWALANLGWMYESGTGVDKDHDKAAASYKAAAELGLPDAMVWFGQMLERGRGVEENMEAAFEWYSRAAETGHPDGQHHVALCYQFGKGVDKDEHMASHWYEKAGAQKHVDALYNLGWLYSQGKGVAKDISKAKELFDIAGRSEVGDSDDLIIEAMDYDQGRGGVHRDLQKAHMLYLKAAKSGSLSAMFAVGSNYEYGRGVEKDWKQALYWYKMAAVKGHPEATFRSRFRRLRAAGEIIRFFRYTGTIRMERGGSDGHAHGTVGRFGGGKSRSTRRRRVRGGRFLLDTDMGEHVEIDLSDGGESLPSLFGGQKITLIYAIRQGLSTGPYMLLVNHEDKSSTTITTARAFWDHQVFGRGLLVGLLLLGMIVGISWITGSWGEQFSSDNQNGAGGQSFLSPFNWLVFAALLIVYGVWVRRIMARRASGIRAVRARMAEIKAWVERLT